MPCTGTMTDGTLFSTCVNCISNQEEVTADSKAFRMTKNWRVFSAYNLSTVIFNHFIRSISGWPIY